MDPRGLRDVMDPLGLRDVQVLLRVSRVLNLKYGLRYCKGTSRIITIRVTSFSHNSDSPDEVSCSKEFRV